MMAMTFQISSTRHISWYLPLLLGRRTTMSQVHSLTNSPVTNNDCMISTKIYHLEGLSFPSALAATSQLLKCSVCIPDGYPARFGKTRLTSQSIFSSAGTPFTISSGSISTSIGSPGRAGGGLPLVDVCPVLWYLLEGY